VAYRVELTTKARRELAALPRDAQERIDARILALSEEPRPSGSKKLEGIDDLYRIRVGDYRIVYRVDDKVVVVLVVRIGHRREVYRQQGRKGTRGR
jgi:mRNA interferase RelE/StbE